MTIEKYSMYTIEDEFVLIDMKAYEKFLKKFRDDPNIKRKREKGFGLYYDYVIDTFTDKDNNLIMRLEKVYIKEDKMSTRTPE